MTIKMASLSMALVVSAALMPVEASTNKTPHYEPCPAEFHAVAMPRTATLCQRFESQEPATMVFYSSAPQQTLIEHYKTAYPGLKVRSTFQGRTLLTADNNAVRVIVSPDSEGSQVDMMVNSQNLSATSK
ncbi:hypothetical protein [Alteromonas sp. C1M14]|uniref:hypothetical protein n=1 Tax=Alteromonas sp. C1M14 TaxID=2841567 RepID=UPI001C0A456A|nr:hypothetical protein [Alteromonas sp. C1M14]MBU2979492.1 hypothetical protein [Alteromonas sp. C1M14]